MASIVGQKLFCLLELEPCMSEEVKLDMKPQRLKMGVKYLVCRKLPDGQRAHKDDEMPFYVPHRSISRRHAILWCRPHVEGGLELRVRDAGTTNGTFVNDERLAPGSMATCSVGGDGTVTLRFGEIPHKFRAWCVVGEEEPKAAAQKEPTRSSGAEILQAKAARLAEIEERILAARSGALGLGGNRDCEATIHHEEVLCDPYGGLASNTVEKCDGAIARRGETAVNAGEEAETIMETAQEVMHGDPYCGRACSPIDDVCGRLEEPGAIAANETPEAVKANERTAEVVLQDPYGGQVGKPREERKKRARRSSMAKKKREGNSSDDPKRRAAAAAAAQRGGKQRERGLQPARCGQLISPVSGTLGITSMLPHAIVQE